VVFDEAQKYYILSSKTFIATFGCLEKMYLMACKLKKKNINS
jgi:hypothetical protein